MYVSQLVNNLKDVRVHIRVFGDTPLIDLLSDLPRKYNVLVCHLAYLLHLVWGGVCILRYVVF